MSTVPTDSSANENVSLSLPADIAGEMQRAAAAFGLRTESYVMILHAISTGKVSRSFLREAQEVFVNDRQVLEELAK
jgi:hypothetical protein